MKILITGGAGFIGSHLADMLFWDHPVCIVDNLSTGRRENIPDSDRISPLFIQGSIGCTAFTSSVFQMFKPDYVIHAAASYKNPSAWHEDSITNVIGTINVLNECRNHGVKKLIYFQTALSYGLKPLQSPITFTHPLFSGGYNGGSSYAISKTAGELYITNSGVPFISFRLANAYGPRNLSGAIPTFYKKLKNKEPIIVSDARRDFIYIDDLVRAVVSGLLSDKTGYYHISTGSDYSIQTIFEHVLNIMNMPMPDNVDFRPRGADDVESILIDPSKTEKDFDWDTKTPLYKGIEQAIKWYDENPVKETFTHLNIK